MIRKTDPETIAPYLRDASNFAGGGADAVVIPESVDELCGFLRGNDGPVVIAGGGTGITGARIPLSGSVVSVEKMGGLEPDGDGVIATGPAVKLADLEDFLAGSPYFYPPNPTEKLAQIGGTVATNASGARSYKFGATRSYVAELEIVLIDGRRTRVARGAKIDQPLRFDDGSCLQFPEVAYRSPACKNAAGYYVQPGMDWIDLFVGSDGTLGVITRVWLRLARRPAGFLGGILFFAREEACWELVRKARARPRPEIDPCALEYFDRNSLQRLRRKHDRVPAAAAAALFFEQALAVPDEDGALLEAWHEFLSGEEVLLDASWFAQSPRDHAYFAEFRHDLPLLINEENNRRGRVKMGTDFAAADARFMPMMRFYREQLAACGLDYVMFGHIGDNHLHINFLPERGDAERAAAIYEILMRQILEWGGTISAEHGIGKLKKQYFARMAGEPALADLRRIKQVFDPRGLLGGGNIFDL